MIKNPKAWIGLATLVGGLYLSAASQPETSQQSADSSAKRVRTGEVTVSAANREMRFSGVTRAAERARLSFAIDGRIVERSVEVGDRVRAGQAIARLDDRELRNARSAARGALSELVARREQTARDVERAESLLAKKAATAEEVEKTRSGLTAIAAAEQAAAARLAEAERMMGEARLEAPFAGTVTEVHFEPGEVVNPGEAVVLLSGAGALELEVEVPESVVARNGRGDRVSVLLPRGGGGAQEATVVSVARAASGPGSLFPVRVELPSGAAVPAGATAELLLTLSAQQALSLPVEAVIDPGGRRPSVFRVDSGNRIEKIAVEVGSLLGDRVVVRGALAAGDRVVIGGQRGLLDGERVEIVSHESSSSAGEGVR
ncbi:MAG: efflux RND transporter periplasmic adaptor subunit [Acidobacteriota bacterium]